MQKSFISSPGFTQSLSRLTENHSIDLLRRKTENKIHILPENWGWVEEFLIGSLKSPSRQTIPALPKFYRRVIVLNICASDLTKYISRGPNICWGNQNHCPRGFDDNRQRAFTRMMCQSYFWFIKPQNQAHDSDYYQWAMRLLPTLFTQSSWHNKQQLLMFPMSRCRIQDTPDRDDHWDHRRAIYIKQSDSGAHYTPRQTTHQQGSLLTPVRVVSHSPLKCDVSSFLSSLLITLVNCSRLTSVDWNSSRDQIMTHFVQFSWYPDDSITRPKCCRAGAGYNYSVMTPAGIVMAPPDLGHPHPHNLGRPRYYLPIFCPRYVSCATKTTHTLILEEMENLLAP